MTPDTDVTTASLSISAKASIAAAILLVAMVGVGLSLTVPLLSLEMERMGISGTMIGFNTAIAGVAAIATVPFVPRLAARIGIGRMLALAIIITALSFIAFRLFFDVRAWFVIRFIFAAALGALFVLSEYWIATTAPAARRGLVMGIYATVLALGFAIGPLILALVGTSGWPPYLAGAALYALAGLPLLAARRHLPDLTHAPGHSILRYIKLLPLATAAGIVFGAVESGAFAFLPVYGVRNGFSAETAAIFLTVTALGNILLQIPLGLLADRFSKSKLILIIAALGIIGALLLPPARALGLEWFYAVLLIWGGVVGGLYTIGLALLASRFTGPDLAGANAAFVLLYNIGLAAGPPYLGIAIDALPAWGLSLAFSSLFLLVLMGGFARKA